jgi:hypothetical protein
MEIATQSDLVTPVRRQMRVGVATDVAQESLVIDAAASVLVEPRDIRNRIPSTQERSAKSREWPVAKSVA